MPRKVKDPAQQRFKEQFIEVMAVTAESGENVKAQWYGQYAIIACLNLKTAWTVAARLKRVRKWQLITLPGRYNKTRRYIKVDFT